VAQEEDEEFIYTKSH